MELTESGVRSTDSDPGAGKTRNRPTGALVLALGLILVYEGARFSGLSADGLHADLGIQYHLAQRTAEGAVPLIDFQHGWNAGSFYLGAALYLLVKTDPALWSYVFQIVMGPALAGAALAVIAWRLRLPGGWLLGLLAGWLWLTHVPHGKYAIPMLWLLLLLPVGRLGRPVPAVAVRLVLGAVTLWLHVELAVLLAAGVAMYDLFAASDVALRERLLRAAAAPAAIAAAFAAQLWIYHAAGLPPGELTVMLLGEPTAVFSEHFGYPLFNPGSFRTLVYPVSLALPFVPVVWRRLSEPTRLAALLHLSQALIAIRRTDEGHVGAASTLLVVVAVLGAWDVLRAGLPRLTDGGAWGRRAAWVVVGGGWMALAIAAGFRVPSLLAIVGLTLVCLLGVAAATRRDHPWASVGAAAVAGVLLVAGLAGRANVELRTDRAAGRAEKIAEAIGPAVNDCGDGSGRAWIVPEPLALYDELGLRNPTPYYAFWYTFAAEEDEVVDLMDAGDIPLIIQPYGWPDSMDGMVDDVEQRYERCDAILVEEDGPYVVLWSFRE